jgi:hypothetical protein
MTDMRFALIEAKDPNEFGQDLMKELAAAGQSGTLPTIAFSHTALPNGKLHYAAVVIRPAGGESAEFEMRGD